MKKIFSVSVGLFVLFGAVGVNAQVIDTVPPVITAPIDQTFATTTFPAAPLLIPATATDDTDSAPVITYTPLAFPVGTTTVTWIATDAAGNNASASSLVVITDATPPVVETVTLAIRDGSTFVGPVSITLPPAGTVDVTPTGSTTPYSIPARSVLALLTSLDTATSSFDITDLQHFNSFGSFLINCIAVSTTTPSCYNWTYAVNGSFPFIGMDKYTLNNGDAVTVFFGSQWSVTTSTSTATTGQTFTVTAQTYDPVTGTFSPAQSEIVGAVQFDSNFTAVEFATSTTDASGNATLSLPFAGAYSVGIQQTGYYPNIPITIASTTAPTGGGGTPAGSGVTHKSLNIPSALSYLMSKQQSNGSFGALLYTDWAAIGLKSVGGSTDALKQYFTTTTLPDSEFVSVTDYMRHAMALQALGINPYSGRNYIAPIVSAFDGTQVGDSALVNDDIFAILTLTHAGYTQSDDIIKKIAAFVLSKQRPNGSWENSPDVTAAAMQALGSLFAVPGVNQGLGRAIGYVVSTQQANGGWGNPDSTAWVMTAINSANEAHPTPESAWTSSAGFFPRDALANDQAPDGGMRSSNDPVDTRVWTTSYALAAASGKSWVTILQSFPILSQTGGGGTPAESLIVATSSSATSTSATSTPEVQPQVLGASTSTLEISTNSSAVTTAMGTTTKKKISKDTVKKVTQTKPMTQPTVPAETKALVPRPQDPLVVRIKNWIWRFLGLQQVTPSFSL